jgi:hypothetical protein
MGVSVGAWEWRAEGEWANGGKGSMRVGARIEDRESYRGRGAKGENRKERVEDRDSPTHHPQSTTN